MTPAARALLRELVPNQIWVKEYPVRLAGARLLTRMTVLRLEEGLCLHSPVPIDAATRSAIDRCGPVRAIIAPSTLHHLFVASAQQAFPDARAFGVAGLETKRTDLRFDDWLGDEPPPLWAGQMEQVVIGNRIMREVELIHRASRTLIATDLVENFSDERQGTNAIPPAYLKLFGPWRPRTAPELRLLTRKCARSVVDRLLAWDFDRAVIAHGELIDREPKKVMGEAWRWVLEG